MQINSSSSSTSSIFNMDEMDSKLSASIISEKDTDKSGTVSASELGVSSSDVAEFDTDGDGVLSSAELTAALKAKREKMQASMSSEMQQNSQLGMLQSTLSGGASQSADEPPSLDNLISGLFSDSETETATVSAASASSSQSSNSGSSLTDYLSEMDANMAETIMSLKDSDGDGTLSAEELGATAEQLSKLDADGDGVLSESELTDGLKAERESMMAENGGMMPPPPPPMDGTSSTSSSTGSSSVTSASSMDSASMDALMQSLFSSTSSTGTSSTSTTSSVSASTLAEFMLRQKASNAYQSMDNLIAGLFDSGAVSQSVSLDA
jgi:trimeric autotransporter adhesin